MKRFSIALAGALTVAMALSVEAAETEQQQNRTFKVQPIGYVQKTDDRTLIVLDKKYQPGLLGLDGFSHIYVFWWFDRNDTPKGRSVLQVHPRGNRENPLTGVFATRSPRRPNLIALTLCRVVAVKENMIEIEKTDAFDGTPVLDIKPYLPGYDTTEDAKVPDWVGRVRAQQEGTSDEHAGRHTASRHSSALPCERSGRSVPRSWPSEISPFHFVIRNRTGFGGVEGSFQAPEGRFIS